MTAPSTVSPRYASASALSFCRIIAEISGGAYCLPSALTRASPFGPATTWYGTIDSSSRTSASLRPIKRLIEKIVFCGFVTAWRLATVPTRRSPDCAKATTEGVVRPPSEFSMTVGSPPSSTAMQELVVPRSIPIVLPIGEGSPSLMPKKSTSECSRSRVGFVKAGLAPRDAWPRHACAGVPRTPARGFASRMPRGPVAVCAKSGGMRRYPTHGRHRAGVGRARTPRKGQALRFLITGGAGFIGSHLAEDLLARGHPVHVLHDLSTGSIR